MPRDGSYRKLETQPLASNTLANVLKHLCERAVTLFQASSVSVWLHDRRAGVLLRAAASDGSEAGSAIPTTDLGSPAARGLRRPPEVSRSGQRRVLTAPLRGSRRALGTLVIEGIDLDRIPRALALDHARELIACLGPRIESISLRGDVKRGRREFENAFNSMTDLVIVCDRQLNIIRANQAFSDRFRLDSEKLTGRPLSSVIGPKTVRCLASIAEPRSAQRRRHPREITDQIGRGTFAITATPLATPDRGPDGVVLVARDIGEQRQLESEGAALRARLSQSEKLAAFGQLVAGIAHELNNPLQSVLGNLELLREIRTIPPDIRRDFRIIYSEANRAAKIIRNLLVFTGSRPLPRRRLSLTTVLSRVAALRATSWAAVSIEFARHLTDDLPRVLGDPLLLQQAFLNILINAEQAVTAEGKGGRIEVNASASPSRRAVIVTIHDNGPGIPTDVLPRIFEPFFTTKEVGKGTGLGLAITYGIIQKHGGNIQAGNAPNGGATFTVELPTAGLMVN